MGGMRALIALLLPASLTFACVPAQEQAARNQSQADPDFEIRVFRDSAGALGWLELEPRA